MRIPWNKGKRPPIEDGGKKWCACEHHQQPVDPYTKKSIKLVAAADGIHQAYCLMCGNYWYN